MPPKRISNSKKQGNVQIMVRLGWSGRRLRLDDPSSSRFDSLNPSSTISDVIERLNRCHSDALPAVIFPGDCASDGGLEGLGEPTVLYMRTAVPRSKWDSTKLCDVGVEGGGNALLTLNLPSSMTCSLSSSPSSSVVTAKLDAGADTKMPPASNPDPSSVSGVQSLQKTCDGAIEKIMSSNFDAASKECVLTLLKIVNNVLSKPGNDRVRSINLSNPSFRAKVGDRNGGVEFLLACGFTVSFRVAAIGAKTEDKLELLRQNESRSRLMSARESLHCAAKELGVQESDLPKLAIPPPSRLREDRGGKLITTSCAAPFDPYRGHMFNTQAAAVGANPVGISPDGEVYVSSIERKLGKLNERAERMEREMTSVPIDRMLCAFFPGSGGDGTTSLDSGGGGGGAGAGGNGVNRGVGVGDASLIAQRAKRIEEERKKREQGGFTTKAMRDLDRMKRAKVYSHTLLKICFPDGFSLSAKFYPSEPVEAVKDVVRSALIHPNCDRPDFDLYVAPPRRVLDDVRTMAEEELVPAAKVHVSWKAGRVAPPCREGYIRSELFQTNAAEFPGGMTVAHTVSSSITSGKSKGLGMQSRTSSKLDEDDMVRQMLGQPKGLPDNGGSKGKNGGGSMGRKPKWFKR